MHAHTHTRTHTHTHTHTHTQTHTYAHTHAHTNTHTPILLPTCICVFELQVTCLVLARSHSHSLQNLFTTKTRHKRDTKMTANSAVLFLSVSVCWSAAAVNLLSLSAPSLCQIHTIRIYVFKTVNNPPTHPSTYVPPPFLSSLIIFSYRFCFFLSLPLPHPFCCSHFFLFILPPFSLLLQAILPKPGSLFWQCVCVCFTVSGRWWLCN